MVKRHLQLVFTNVTSTGVAGELDFSSVKPEDIEKQMKKIREELEGKFPRTFAHCGRTSDIKIC